MTAATSSTLGPGASPPVAPAQGGAPRVAPSRPGHTAARQGTRHAREVTSATQRQLDYWVSVRGLLGARPQVGSGGRREFDDVDLEIIETLARLASIGCKDRWLEFAVDAIRGTRVRQGEWLLVTIAGHALRCTPADLPRIVHHAGAPHAAWLVPLQAFDQGQPQ